MKHKVFVYGTLKRGKKNHHLMKTALFINDGFLQSGYVLYYDDHPCLVEEDSPKKVFGELYEVDDETLEKLDELEEHPTWYVREEREIALSDGGLTKAWVYLFPKRLLKTIRPLETGCFE